MRVVSCHILARLANLADINSSVAVPNTVQISALFPIVLDYQGRYTKDATVPIMTFSQTSQIREVGIVCAEHGL